MNVTICGAGNAAHVLVPVLSVPGNLRVTVYTSLEDEAERWAAALSDEEAVTVRMPDGGLRTGWPARVTADPAVAAAEAHLVLLALPAFAHESVLRALVPHLPPAAWIAALPARGGFDWLAHEVLPAHRGPLVGLQTLPWACRIRSWGKEAEILGIKTSVDLAAWPPDLAGEAAARLASLLQVGMQPAASFLALTLANTGQLIHPSIMYGLFHAWDGTPFTQDEAPLFYGGVDGETAAVLQTLSDEVQAVCMALQQRLPQLDLSSVLPLDAWLHRSYAGQIDDTRTLQSSFNTNRAYAGLRAPVRRVAEDACVPAFEARYLSEDVPFGLLVTRGIAELAGVATPTMDRVIEWAQDKLGKEYLVHGCVAGRDVPETRAPQRFGIKDEQGLVHGGVNTRIV